MSDEAQSDAPEEAPKKKKKAEKKRKPERAKASKPAKAKGRREWRGIDSAIAAVLIANVLLLAVIVSVPGGGDVPPDTSKGAEHGGRGDRVTKTDRPHPELPEDREGGVDVARIPLLPRNELWQRSQREAARGDVDAAIVSLKLLLRQEPHLGEVPRRAVWLQLSYYAGLVGREEDAARWLRLSKSSHETGLTPDELMRIAVEAHSARDWSEARRYAARFLLQRGQVGRGSAEKVARAYMMLGDSYRDEAGVRSPVEVEDKAPPTGGETRAKDDALVNDKEGDK